MGKTRSVGIVGMGHVGAHVASSLLAQGLVDELLLCDVDRDKVRSEAQDLGDALSFYPYNAHIEDCGDSYEDLAGCDIVVNAAGNVGLSKKDRDGELHFTTDACRTFAERVENAGFDGIWLTISNPCDVVATEIWKLTGHDPRRVIGSGTGLDSSRLRAQLARITSVDPKSIDAYMIGEHGSSMLAAWTAASFSGKPLAELAEELPERFAFDRAEVEQRARYGGYVTMAGKGCTEYAVAGAAARLVAAIFHDERSIIAASTLMTGEYGEEGIFTSLPCIVGANGVEAVLPPRLSGEEEEAFHASCAHIRDNISKLAWWPEG